MAEPTPSQTIGPFFHFALTDGAGTVAEMAGEAALGERIVIDGRIVDGEGAGVADAMVEIWQANAAGRYAHQDDNSNRPLDPSFRGFGRCATDDDGRFTFRTVKPGPVPGRGNALQAPHVGVTVFARGLLRHLVTRLYFADDALTGTDPVLALVPDERRKTLLADRHAVDGEIIYRHVIVLQGERETVFFDV